MARAHARPEAPLPSGGEGPAAGGSATPDGGSGELRRCAPPPHPAPGVPPAGATMDGEGQQRGLDGRTGSPRRARGPGALRAVCAEAEGGGRQAGPAAPEGGWRLWAGTRPPRRGGRGVGGRGSHRPTAARRLAPQGPPRRPIGGRSRPSRGAVANAGRRRRRPRPAPSRCVSVSVRRRSRVVLLFSWGTRCAMCYLRRNSRRRRQQPRRHQQRQQHHQQQQRPGSGSGAAAGTRAGEDAGRPPAAPAA